MPSPVGGSEVQVADVIRTRTETDPPDRRADIASPGSAGMGTFTAACPIRATQRFDGATDKEETC